MRLQPGERLAAGAVVGHEALHGNSGAVNQAGARAQKAAAVSLRSSVPERAQRRTFTAACKQEILAAYGMPVGEKGAVLRRACTPA